MNINAISGSLPLSQISKVTSSNPIEQVGSDFWAYIQNMNNTQQVAQEKNYEVTIGKSDDTHGALIAADKAALQTDIAVTVRDKVTYGINKLLDMQI